MERDRLKQTAKFLAIRDQGKEPSAEQKMAWVKYKKLRNKINNTKKSEERSYKSNKITEDLDSPEKVWKTSKLFMGWKSTGTPNQLEVDGQLVTKPISIAKLMNDF